MAELRTNPDVSVSRPVPRTASGAAPRSAPSAVSLALLAGWLVPGAGHLLTRHWVRALLLFVSITTMWSLGLAMQGKLYVPGGDDPFGTLGFVGDLGSGVLYLIGLVAGVGRAPVQVVTADYGTKFIIVASLLNVIAAVDAHNLRIGRKPSGVTL